MKQSNNNHLWMILALLMGVSSLSMAQTDDQSASEPTTNTGPDGIDTVADVVVGTGAALGPNEISIANAIELICPQLISALQPEPQPQPVNSDSEPTPVSTGGAEPEQCAENEILVDGECQFDLIRMPIQTHARLSGDAVDLTRRCTEILQFNSRSGSGGDASGLNDILRAWNMDEAAAQNRGLVEFSSIGIAAVAARLKALRVADAGGPGEVLAFQHEQLDYHFETGGGAGDHGFGRWTIYANGELFTGDRDTTGLEQGFDLDGGRATVGTDYRLNDTTFLGASLAYISATSDFTNDSELETDGLDLTLYGTVFTDTGMYFEGTVGFGRSDYEQSRRVQYAIPAVPGPGLIVINQTALSDTESDQMFASAGIGKDFTIGGGVTTSLSAHLNYLDAEIDGFTETIAPPAPGFGLALTVGDQDVTSLRSNLGAQISKAISTERGVVVPFARADWIHEFDNDPRSIVASFASDSVTSTSFQLTTEEPDQDYFRLGGGLSAVFAGGLQAFVSLDTTLGLSDLSYYSVTAGLSKEL